MERLGPKDAWRRAARRTAAAAGFAALAFGAACAGAQEPRWQDFTTPAIGPAMSIGGYSNGCLMGGEALPPEGVGYQVIRLSRNRYTGHPALIGLIEDLGVRVAGAGLGTMLVGDIGQPRGGPMPSGHRSHQIGLDADIWLRLDLPPLPRPAREDLQATLMVDAAARRVDPRVWSGRQALLIALAAADPRVARVFVNPAIKLALCGMDWTDRSWLRRVRPWPGHDTHFHIRLNCPEGDATCRPQDPPPDGDGCGEELMSWFPDPDAPPVPAAEPEPPAPRPPLPPLCLTMVGPAP